MALSRAQLKTAITNAITDPYNQQNTASLLRAVLFLLTDNLFNVNDDSVNLTGDPGADGRTILSGSTAPAVDVGLEGDLYWQPNIFSIYGPKTASGWGTPVSLKGADGKTNFELWQQLHPNDTLEQFFAAMKGAPGQDGRGIRILGILSNADADSDGIPDALPCCGKKGDAYMIPKPGTENNPEPEYDLWIYLVGSATWLNVGSIGVSLASTDDLPEGQTNLYYTDARVYARIALALMDYYTSEYIDENFYTKPEIDAMLEDSMVDDLTNNFIFTP